MLILTPGAEATQTCSHHGSARLFTFNRHFFNLLRFLINPFLLADLLRGSHQLFQLFDFLQE